MVDHKMEKIVCPKCGHVIQRQRYSLIDSADVKAREDLIHGDFFYVTCPSCGWSDEIPYSLEYHDGLHNVSIAYADDEAAEKEFQKEADQIKEKETFRITTDPTSLAEKALIFHEGWDDRMIELVKEMMWLAVQDTHPEYDGFLFNVGTFQDGHTGPAMVPYSDGNVVNEPYPMDEKILHMIQNEYEEIAEVYSGNSPYVDNDWAVGFMDYVDDMQEEENEDMEAVLQVHPEKDDVDAFLEKFYDLDENSSSDRRTASFVKRNFPHIWKLVKNHADFDEQGKVVFDFNRNPYSSFLPDWFDDVDMVLLNAEDFAYRKKLSELQLRETNTDDPLVYHNLRRAVFESIRELSGSRKALAYLNAWKKEEPGSAYIAGTEIDYYLEKHDLKKAEKLADACLHMPLKQKGDDWLLDSCENVYQQLNRRDKIREVNALRKALDKKDSDIRF
jgi:ribosomal protein S27E